MAKVEASEIRVGDLVEVVAEFRTRGRVTSVDCDRFVTEGGHAWAKRHLHGDTDAEGRKTWVEMVERAPLDLPTEPGSLVEVSLDGKGVGVKWMLTGDVLRDAMWVSQYGVHKTPTMFESWLRARPYFTMKVL